jgi:hypothetical protein
VIEPMKRILAGLALMACAAAQKSNNPKIKTDLSDEFAKAAIKYVVAVQNFELNATTDTTERAESRIESAKVDMEAAETTFGCDEKTASLKNGVACPEHMTSFFLELQGLTYVTYVKIFHSDFKPEEKAQMDKSAACLNAWKNTLQRRDKTQPAACETSK